MASPTSISPALASLLWDSPVILPPNGETANMVDPPNLIANAVAAVSVEFTLIAVTFLIRAYTKLCLNRRVLWEDIFITIAIGTFVSMNIFAIVGVYQGFGVNEWNMTFGNMSRLLYYADVVEIHYGVSILFAKLSILLQFRRFFVPQRSGNEVMWYTLHIFIAAHTAFYIAHIAIFLFGCTPRARFWNPLLPGTCVDLNAMIMASAIINVVSDFAILVLPICRIWNMQASRRQKWGLTGLFAVGALCCAASILRTLASWAFTHDADVTYHIFWVGLWAGVEVFSAILASNVPYAAHVYASIQTKRERRQARRRLKDIEDSITTALTHPTTPVVPSTLTTQTGEPPSQRSSHGAAELEKPPLVRETARRVPDFEPDDAIEKDPPTRSPPPQPRWDVPAHYMEAFFNPPAQPGAHTHRHELETGLRPGTIVSAMRRAVEMLDNKRGSVVDDGRQVPAVEWMVHDGWFE